MTERKVRIGVVGVGNVAEVVYLPNVAKLRQVELVAVCDVVADQAKKIQEMFDVPECYFGVDDMLSQSDIEAVVILSSIPTHVQLTLAAISAGKHVYVEKPIATNLDDANRVIAEADKAGIKLACAPPTILNPNTALIKELIEEGIVGKICYAMARASSHGPGRFFYRTTDISWFYKPGGGPLFDIGVYAFQDLTYILGPARRVTALAGTSIPEIIVRSGPLAGERLDVEVDDSNLILLDFGGATFAFVDATYCMWATRGPRREFYGRDGVLTVTPPGSPAPFEVFKEDYEFGVGGWMEPTFAGLGIRISIAQQKQREYEGLRLAAGVGHLADCILEDRKPLISGERARHVLEIMLAATESSRSGRAVELTTTV